MNKLTEQFSGKIPRLHINGDQVDDWWSFELIKLDNWKFYRVVFECGRVEYHKHNNLEMIE